MISAKIIADSIGEGSAYGISDVPSSRLTTFVLVFPRIVLAEFNTHRMISKNSASSRAIPFKKMLEMVQNNPFIPLGFQKDHSGMQGSEYLEGDEAEAAKKSWLEARDLAVSSARHLNAVHGVTKQLCNRILEPFMYHTVIATGTDWQNFFALRAHEAAEIHIQKLAQLMLEEYNKSIPKILKYGEWHTPFGDQLDTERLNTIVESHPDFWREDLHKFHLEQITDQIKVKIATARCARVSYMNFEGKDDYEADIKLHDRLLEQGHMSPFEHCAQHVSSNSSGNLSYGWRQYRKFFNNEDRTDTRVSPVWKKIQEAQALLDGQV